MGQRNELNFFMRMVRGSSLLYVLISLESALGDINVLLYSAKICPIETVDV
jgi:hypothetical protein